MSLLESLKAGIRGAWRRRYMIVFPLLILLPAVVAATLLWPKKYETSALLLLQEHGGLSGNTPAYALAQEIRGKVKGIEALIGSEFIVRSVLARKAGSPSVVTERDIEDFRSRISVEQVGTQFVSVKLRGSKRVGLGNELETLVAALFESLLSSSDTAIDATSFLVRQRQKDLQAMQARIAALERQAGAGTNTAVQAKQDKLSRARLALTGARAKLEEAERALRTRLLEVLPDAPAHVSIASLVQVREAKLAALKPGAAVAGSVSEPERQTLERLRTLVDSEKQVNALARSYQAAATTAQTAERELADARNVSQQRAGWESELSTLKSRYQQFTQRLPASGPRAAINLLKAPARIQVIDTPKDPKRPLNSRLKILLAGFVASIIFAMALAVMAEQLDNSIRSAGMLRAATRDLPVIARFPSLPGGTSPPVNASPRPAPPSSG